MASNQQSSNANDKQNPRPESPYYIDPSETQESFEPPLVLSGSDNYPKWYRAINVALALKKKLGFADGTIAVPAKEDPIYGAWKKCNKLVLSWICKALSPKINDSVKEMRNAVDVWKDLKKRYSPGDQFIISDILEEIYSLRQGKRTVTKYFTESNILWSQLETLRPPPLCSCKKKCSCGALQRVNEQREQEKVARFLKGLDDRFAATRSRIMREDPLPSLDNVFTLVVLEEKQIVNGAKQSKGVKQHQSQPPSSSDHATPKTKVTRIEKLVPMHPHSLTLKPAGAPYKCKGCQELGFGRSYRCESSVCNYVLHEECANAVVDGAFVCHPFLKKSNFSFYEEPPSNNRVCDGCRKDVRGFVYHCSHTDMDLHPCCLKLKHSISDKEKHVRLELRQTIPKKCLKCKSKKVENESKVKGWSYVSSDRGYCYHVSCFKELILEKWKEGYFSREQDSMQTDDPETQLAPTSKKMVKVERSSKNSSITKICKIAAVVFQLVFSAIFGDPVSFVLGLVQAVSRF